MRKRTPYPTTPDSSRFSITAKGLRACGATNMETTAAQLRQMAEGLDQAAGLLMQEMPAEEDTTRHRRRRRRQPKMFRRGTVCGRYRETSKSRVPDLRLSGLWLRGAGFDLGQKYEVEVEDGTLMIRAQPSPSAPNQAPAKARPPKP